MKEIKIRFDLVETKVVAKVDGYDRTLTEEQLLDYLRLLDVEEELKSATKQSDIEQLTDRQHKLRARIEKPYDYMNYHWNGI